MKKGRKIDWFLFIYFVIYVTFVFIYNLIVHFIIEGRAMVWIFPSISMLLIIGYLFIRKDWFLYFCITPILTFFTFVFVYCTIGNLGFKFSDYDYVMITYVFPEVSN